MTPVGWAALGSFWHERGYLQEGWTGVAPGCSSPYCRRLERPGGSRSPERGGLELWQALAESAQVAACFHRLGELAHMRGNYVRAADLLNQAVARARAAGDRLTEAAALGSLGRVALDQDDLDLAANGTHQALEICRELDWPRGIADALNEIATSASTVATEAGVGLLGGSSDSTSSTG